MVAVTFVLGLIASVLVLAVRPVYGFCIYLVALFGYSQSLTIPLGTIDFTLGRIVILAVLAKAIFSPGLLRSFKWNWMDTGILVCFLGPVLALTQNAPARIFLEREAGTFFNTVMVYFAARLIIRTRNDWMTVIKGFACVGIPVALMAMVQSKTGHNPVGFMQQHYAWGLAPSPDARPEMRMGFYRASVTLPGSIILGLFLAGIAPLALTLWPRSSWPRPAVLIVFGMLMLGACASMSSGPLFAIVVTLALLMAFPLRRFWPILLVALVANMLFVEVFSNRHFYHVLTGLALNPQTAYYRIGLVEEAFGGGMTGHWLAGYGYVGIGPGTDNTNFHWMHKDFVNIYVGKLARYGLLGLVPYLFVNFLYYRRLLQAAKRTRAKADKWMIWCLMATLVGWNVAMMTVAALGQVSTLLYVFIAVANNMPGFVTRRVPARAKSPAPSRRRGHRRAWRPHPHLSYG